jgi:hypothetical protein
MTDRILSRQFHGAEGAEAWRVLPDGAYAFFRTDLFSTSARFVEAISGLVREGDEPYIDIRGDGVTVLIRAFGRVAGRWCGDHPSRRVGAVGRGRVAGGGRPRGGWPDRPSQSRGELLDTRRSGRQRGGRRDDVGAGSGRVSVRSAHRRPETKPPSLQGMQGGSTLRSRTPCSSTWQNDSAASSNGIFRLQALNLDGSPLPTRAEPRRLVPLGATARPW